MGQDKAKWSRSLATIEQERDDVKARLAERLSVTLQDKQAIKMLENTVSMGNLALRNENIKNIEFLIRSCADKTQLLLKDVGSTIIAVQKLPDLLENEFQRGKIEGGSQEKQSQTVILLWMLIPLLLLLLLLLLLSLPLLLSTSAVASIITTAVTVAIAIFVAAATIPVVFAVSP